MKAEGILNLGAILKKSRPLVVVWDPSYLSRPNYTHSAGSTDVKPMEIRELLELKLTHEPEKQQDNKPFLSLPKGFALRGELRASGSGNSLKFGNTCHGFEL